VRDKIIAKMTCHVESILSRETISPEEFSTLQAFLALLDYEESKRKLEEDSKKNDERLTKAMGLILGGGFGGV